MSVNSAAGLRTGEPDPEGRAAGVQTRAWPWRPVSGPCISLRATRDDKAQALSAEAYSRSRKARRRTLPVIVVGSWSRKAIARGYL